MRSTIQVFAYGSNLCERRMVRRVSSARCIGRCRLTEYTLRFNKKSDDLSGKANVVATGLRDDVVEGVIYEIDAGQKPILDDFERGYDLVDVVVELVDGTARTASVYIAARGRIDDTLVPYSWYLRLIVEGGCKHGLPERYLRQLASATTKEDPKPERYLRESADGC